jgi:hypothetical protein
MFKTGPLSTAQRARARLIGGKRYAVQQHLRCIARNSRGDSATPSTMRLGLTRRRARALTMLINEAAEFLTTRALSPRSKLGGPPSFVADDPPLDARIGDRISRLSATPQYPPTFHRLTIWNLSLRSEIKYIMALVETARLPICFQARRWHGVEA